MERFGSFLASHLPIDSVAASVDNCRLLKTFQCVWVWMDVGFTLNWKCWGVGGSVQGIQHCWFFTFSVFKCSLLMEHRWSQIREKNMPELQARLGLGS